MNVCSVINLSREMSTLRMSSGLGLGFFPSLPVASACLSVTQLVWMVVHYARFVIFFF